MANRNPSPATRFKPGATGRPQGSRDRISQAFLTDLAETWRTHGIKALVYVAENDQSTFVKLPAALLAKEIEIKRPLDGMDDSALLQAIEALTEIMRASAPTIAEDGETPKVLQ